LIGLPSAALSLEQLLAPDPWNSRGLPKAAGVPLDMSRIHPECLGSGHSDLRQEPDEAEDEEERALIQWVKDEA
jgi:hypothetical protein